MPGGKHNTPVLYIGNIWALHYQTGQTQFKNTFESWMDKSLIMIPQHQYTPLSECKRDQQSGWPSQSPGQSLALSPLNCPTAAKGTHGERLEGCHY